MISSSPEHLARELLESAIRAPSGENAQPWRFEVHANADVITIDVYVVSERDNSPYAWGNRSGYVAIGAALENIRIKTADMGLFASIAFMPDEKDPLHAARVEVTRRECVYGTGLIESIISRVSNRKPYSVEVLDRPLCDELIESNSEIGWGKIQIVTDDLSKKRIGVISSFNERIMLGNQKMHQFFFSHVNWTKEEDERKKVGFFIDTLELPLPVRFAFYIIRHWIIAQQLNLFLKFNIVAASSNASLYSRAAAIGCISMPSNTEIDALKAGMVVERVWLTATKLGLSFQSLAGMPYLSMRSRSQSTEFFATNETEWIRQYNDEVRKVYDLRDGTPFFLFRVGRAKAPTARSIRFSVDDVTTFCHDNRTHK